MCGWGELRSWVHIGLLYPSLLAGTLECPVWGSERSSRSAPILGAVWIQPTCSVPRLRLRYDTLWAVQGTIVSGTSRVSVGLIPPQKAALTLAAPLWLN